MKLGVSFAELMKKKKGKKKRAPVPARDVRKPVVDHNLRGNEVNGNRHGPVVDVIDGQGVPKARIHKPFAVGGKGAAHRRKGGKFAQRRHQKVHHHADHEVGRKRPARSRLTDRGAGGHKKPGTDRAPEREHRQMPGLQDAFELMVGCVSVGRTADFVLSVVSTATLGGILGANHSPKDRKISINVG